KGGTGVFSARPAGHYGREFARKGRIGQAESSGHSVTGRSSILHAVATVKRRFGIPLDVPAADSVFGTLAASPTKWRPGYRLSSNRFGTPMPITCTAPVSWEAPRASNPTLRATKVAV